MRVTPGRLCASLRCLENDRGATAVAARNLPPQVLAARLLPIFRALAAGSEIDDRDNSHIAGLLAELAATRGSVDGGYLSRTARFHRGVGQRRSPVEFAAVLSRAFGMAGMERVATPAAKLGHFVNLVDESRTDPAAARVVLRVLEVTNRLINGGAAPQHPTVEALTQFALAPESLDIEQLEETTRHLNDCEVCTHDVETAVERRAWLSQLPPAE
jgi:hypothetical protein